ncbi:MAG: riboflavin biosynthesis protein RibF, partial [Bacteroidales bacterium]|nr:riboflavin biosynthesis protein RibF [Bacteroidales bacterium]
MIATTGFFDGVHTGHRLVIERLVSLARERGDESLVVTFWPHPRAVLQDGARELRLLTTLEEKKALLSALGVSRIEVLDFTRPFAALTAEEYLRDVLRDRFGVKTLLVGYDNRLGSDRLTAPDLAPIAASIGMELIFVDECLEGCAPSGQPISSTKIRTALQEGRIEEATEMLGYGYSLTGVVVAGNRMGRTIGFPTANLRLYEPLKLIPAMGVYVVDAEVLGRKYRGMTDIGTRPTVGGTFPTIETHILDFDEDIYGLPLTITFLRRLRDEIHFPSLDALKSQLELDRAACR